MTALLFLSCWLAFGRQSPALALVYCLLLAGFIVATFIDFEHFIIPDAITLGGIAAGFISSFLVPSLHGAQTKALSLERCLFGIIVGAGLAGLTTSVSLVPLRTPSTLIWSTFTFTRYCICFLAILSRPVWSACSTGRSGQASLLVDRAA